MSASPAERAIPGRTATQDSLLLREVLQSISALSCPTTYNFHMHTNRSDGKLTPAELMEQAVEIGLQGMAITDHHTLKAYFEAREWMEAWRWRNPSSWQPRDKSAASKLPKLWTGVEITSRLADTDVHILGYAFQPDAEVMRPYLKKNSPQGDERQAARVINSIQTAGGIAVLAHPARYRVTADILIREAAKLGIDGVETYYAYDNPKQWRPSPERTARIQAMAHTHNLLSSCGTDTHGRVLTRRL